MQIRAVIVAAGAAAFVLGLADVASAACTKLAFSVNDYGKEGPAKDAKNLLDKYIAKWTAERNIKGYKVGPKEVTCELFLNFVVFDEHTCKATANVCWSGDAPKKVQDAKAGPATNAKRSASAKNAAKGRSPAIAKAPAAKAVAKKAAAIKAPVAKAAAIKAPVAKAAASKAPATKSAAELAIRKSAPAAVSPIATGSVKPPAAASKVAPAAAIVPVAPLAPAIAAPAAPAAAPPVPGGGAD